jgi:hypothetical protein
MNEPVFLPYTALSDAARRFLRRKKLFRQFDQDFIDYVIDRRDIIPLGYAPLFTPDPLTTKHKERTLYLVKGLLKGVSFYKIGLTLHKNPLRRDPRVYKESVRTYSVPTDHAHIYESYCLWRCRQSDKKKPYDDDVFGGWAGQGEVINSTDDAIVDIVDKSYSSLNGAICKYGFEEAMLELIALNILVYAVYDEWYLYSGHAIAAYARMIESQYGTNTVKIEGEHVNIQLSPLEKSYLARRLVSNLAPVVDRKWDELGIRDPRKRYEMTKAKIAARREDRWGNRDTSGWSVHRVNYRSYESNEEYASRNRFDIIDFDKNHGKIFS